MKLPFKEDPREWRKTTLIGLIGPAVITGILRWRGVISTGFLSAVLAVIAVAALCVCLRPCWFRGHYRFTLRLGFYTTQIVGKVVLVALFFFILTPFGWILRLLGKDFLQLKSPKNQKTFWHPARPDSSFDRMF
jgi:hypothetical protein